MDLKTLLEKAIINTEYVGAHFRFHRYAGLCMRNESILIIILDTYIRISEAVESRDWVSRFGEVSLEDSCCILRKAAQQVRIVA